MGFKTCFQAPDYFDEEEDKIVMSSLVCWLRMVITTIQYNTLYLMWSMFLAN